MNISLPHTARIGSGPLPTPGRIVGYVSRTGNYWLPAMVVATRNELACNLFQPGVEAGAVPDLSSKSHVHLAVLSVPLGVIPSEGEQGWRAREGLGYNEADVPHVQDQDPAKLTPHSWFWLN